MSLKSIIVAAFRPPKYAPKQVRAEAATRNARVEPTTGDQSRPRLDAAPSVRSLKGKCYVIDGDTIVISSTKIRIGGIDAPELNQPYGKTSKFALIEICKGKVVTAVVSEEMSYDRVVAKCYLPDGSDVAAKLVEKGLALDWPRFSGGAYRHLEPADARRRLWRADAKQKGRMAYVERFDTDRS